MNPPQLKTHRVSGRISLSDKCNESQKIFQKMSWLFGKKKHHRESPPETPEEPSLNNVQPEDYIIIEKEENPLSPTSSRASGSLYPQLGGTMLYPPLVGQQQNQLPESQSYISGIPFKLSKTLNNDYEVERLRIDEITAFVHQIINQDYDYEFNLERSIINEMDTDIETIKFMQL